MNGLVVFAFGAGMLSTVNPCGFALLPAFLAYNLGLDDVSTPTPRQRAVAVGRRVTEGLRTGALVSAGFATVFVVTGLLVAVGLRTIIGAVPWAAAIIGVLLTGLGVAQVAGRHIGVTLGGRLSPRRNHGPAGMIAFGAAYAVASLSCTLAVLLALIAQALAASSVATFGAVFAAYSAGSAAVLILLALSAALTSSALSAVLRRVSRYLSRLAGVVLVASGLYLIAYWAPVLWAGSPNTALTTSARPFTSAVSNFVQLHTTQITVTAAVTVVTALVAGLWTRRHLKRESRTKLEPAHPKQNEAGEHTAPTAATPH